MSAIKWPEDLTKRAVEISNLIDATSPKILNGAVILESELCMGKNSYICQSYDDYQNAILGNRKDIKINYADAHIFLKPDDWAAFYRRNSALVTGSRVHGAIAALSQGNPAVCTAGDLRAYEMLDLISLKPWRQRTLPATSNLIQNMETAYERQNELHDQFLRDFKDVGFLDNKVKTF